MAQARVWYRRHSGAMGRWTPGRCRGQVPQFTRFH